jgi:hypothetical protein
MTDGPQLVTDPGSGVAEGIGPGEPGAIVDVDDIYGGGQFTDTERYELRTEPVETRDDSVDSLIDAEAIAGETDDPMLASQEGMPYVPPTDHSDRLDGLEGDDHPSELTSVDDELSERVRDALRADASTTAYADSIEIRSGRGVVVLRGTVDDLEDSDALAAVAETVRGVTEVRDELAVAGL